MSKKIKELVQLLREAEEVSAPCPAPAEDAVQPGADANGEAKADLDKEVEDLDKPQDDQLLPESEGFPGDEQADPKAVVPVESDADDSQSAISDKSELSVDELANEVDPDIADLIRMMAEAEELDDSVEDKEKDSEAKSEEDKEPKKDEPTDEDDKEDKKDEKESEEAPKFGDVDNVTLGDDEVKDVADKAAEDSEKKPEDKAEEAALPGTDDLSKDQQFVLKRLFDESVSLGIKAALPKVVKLTEARLNAKFKAIVEARDNTTNEQIQHYLKYVVETWTEKNKPAIFTNAQVKAAEKIFESVRTLVEMYDIKTIDSTGAIIKMYESRVAKATETANKLITENAKLVKEVSLRDRALVIESSLKGLPLTEVERFKAAAIKIKASDLQTFKENVEAVRASLIAKPKKPEASRPTNEALVLQGGVKSSGNSRNERDLLGNLMATANLKQ